MPPILGILREPSLPAAQRIIRAPSASEVPYALITGMEEISSHSIRSADADIFYWSLGNGPAVVLLHPFPANHEFWLPVAHNLATRYRVILPDLRGHGESGVGEGPATMVKHAADLARVINDAGIDRAPFIGVSIGGYVLMEFWRQHRHRITALGLCNTKASADAAEARSSTSCAD